MKLKYLLIAFAVNLSALISAQAVVITDFNMAGGLIVDGHTKFPVAEDIDGNLYVQGLYGNSLGVSFDPVSIAGLNQIYLTATIHSDEGLYSQFWLYNTDYSKYMMYEVWLDTVGTSSTFLLQYMDIQDHDPFTDIAAFDFFTDGSPSQSLEITFENLAAIPEPHTYALIVSGLLAGVLIARRRHRKITQA